MGLGIVIAPSQTPPPDMAESSGTLLRLAKGRGFSFLSLTPNQAGALLRYSVASTFHIH